MMMGSSVRGHKNDGVQRTKKHATTSNSSSYSSSSSSSSYSSLQKLSIVSLCWTCWLLGLFFLLHDSDVSSHLYNISNSTHTPLGMADRKGDVPQDDPSIPSLPPSLSLPLSPPPNHDIPPSFTIKFDQEINSVNDQSESVARKDSLTHQNRLVESSYQQSMSDNHHEKGESLRNRLKSGLEKSWRLVFSFVETNNPIFIIGIVFYVITAFFYISHVILESCKAACPRKTKKKENRFDSILGDSFGDYYMESTQEDDVLGGIYRTGNEGEEKASRGCFGSLLRFMFPCCSNSNSNDKLPFIRRRFSCCNSLWGSSRKEQVSMFSTPISGRIGPKYRQSRGIVDEGLYSVDVEVVVSDEEKEAIFRKGEKLGVNRSPSSPSSPSSSNNIIIPTMASKYSLLPLPSTPIAKYSPVLYGSMDLDDGEVKIGGDHDSNGSIDGHSSHGSHDGHSSQQSSPSTTLPLTQILRRGKMNKKKGNDNDDNDRTQNTLVSGEDASRWNSVESLSFFITSDPPIIPTTKSSSSSLPPLYSNVHPSWPIVGPSIINDELHSSKDISNPLRVRSKLSSSTLSYSSSSSLSSSLESSHDCLVQSWFPSIFYFKTKRNHHQHENDDLSYSCCSRPSCCWPFSSRRNLSYMDDESLYSSMEKGNKKSSSTKFIASLPHTRERSPSEEEDYLEGLLHPPHRKGCCPRFFNCISSRKDDEKVDDEEQHQQHLQHRKHRSGSCCRYPSMCCHPCHLLFKRMSWSDILQIMSLLSCALAMLVTIIFHFCVEALKSPTSWLSSLLLFSSVLSIFIAIALIFLSYPPSKRVPYRSSWMDMDLSDLEDEEDEAALSTSSSASKSYYYSSSPSSSSSSPSPTSVALNETRVNPIFIPSFSNDHLLPPGSSSSSYSSQSIYPYLEP
jgi:hypothetical protein